MFKPYIKLWKRFWDNKYIVWSQGHDPLVCCFWQLNYKEPKIQFTIEKEEWHFGFPWYLDSQISWQIDYKSILQSDTYPEIYPLVLKLLKKIQTQCFKWSNSLSTLALWSWRTLILWTLEGWVTEAIEGFTSYAKWIARW